MSGGLRENFWPIGDGMKRLERRICGHLGSYVAHMYSCDDDWLIVFVADF